MQTEELKLEVERLKEALKKKEKENEELINKLKEISDRMQEFGKKMEDKMAEKIDELLNTKFMNVNRIVSTRQKFLLLY